MHRIDGAGMHAMSFMCDNASKKKKKKYIAFISNTNL